MRECKELLQSELAGSSGAAEFATFVDSGVVGSGGGNWIVNSERDSGGAGKQRQVATGVRR